MFTLLCAQLSSSFLFGGSAMVWLKVAHLYIVSGRQSFPFSSFPQYLWGSPSSGRGGTSGQRQSKVQCIPMMPPNMI